MGPYDKLPITSTDTDSSAHTVEELVTLVHCFSLFPPTILAIRLNASKSVIFAKLPNESWTVTENVDGIPAARLVMPDPDRVNLVGSGRPGSTFTSMGWPLSKT